MIDANTIADLQMRMNAGDGRQAVLTNLLQLETGTQSAWTDSFLPLEENIVAQHASQAVFNWPIYSCAITGSFRICKNTGTNKIYCDQMAEDLVELIDKLSSDAKLPLQIFAEELAFDFNNLFMVILGHISIVMTTKDTSHLAHAQLRKCEELILNMAALLRLLVDVFQTMARRQDKLKLIHPVERKNARSNTSDSGFHPTVWASPDPDLLVQLMMGIIANCVSAHLNGVFQRITNLIREALGSTELRMVELRHYRNVMLNLEKGGKMALERLVWSHKINQKFRLGITNSNFATSENHALESDLEHLKSG